MLIVNVVIPLLQKGAEEYIVSVVNRSDNTSIAGDGKEAVDFLLKLQIIKGFWAGLYLTFF